MFGYGSFHSHTLLGGDMCGYLEKDWPTVPKGDDGCVR